MYPKLWYKAILSVTYIYNRLQIKEMIKLGRECWMQALGAFGGYSIVVSEILSILWSLKILYYFNEAIFHWKRPAVDREDSPSREHTHTCNNAIASPLSEP
jgi:hypothetical protein